MNLSYIIVETVAVWLGLRKDHGFGSNMYVDDVLASIKLHMLSTCKQGTREKAGVGQTQDFHTGHQGSLLFYINKKHEFFVIVLFCILIR